MRKNPYIVLGVGRKADLKDIKRAYRRAAKKSHPDLAARTENDRFREIQEAYETLKDENRRRCCDEALERDEAGGRVLSRRSARRAVPRTEVIGGRPMPEPLIGGGPGPTWAAPPEMALEIVLSPEEARTGGRFQIRVPVEARCPECAGALPWVFFCRSCGGIGRVQRIFTETVALPAGVRNGSLARLEREDGLVCHLLFRIDPGR